MVEKEGLKLNLGCGFRKKDGFINVDSDPSCLPDECIDLVDGRWPWAGSSVDEIVFEYSMEQMGSTIRDLRHVVSEVYRIARPGCRVFVTAFHPRHDQFALNPACTQRLSPDFFHLLSIGRNLNMISAGQPHDVFGMKWGVNFEVARFKYLIASTFQEDVESGRITEDEIRRRMTFENNVCQAFEVDLEVQKAGVDPQP